MRDKIIWTLAAIIGLTAAIVAWNTYNIVPKQIAPKTKIVWPIPPPDGPSLIAAQRKESPLPPPIGKPGRSPAAVVSASDRTRDGHVHSSIHAYMMDD